jgi:hypothetical protein
MEEFLKLAERLSSVGLATLLLLVLVGNKMRIWRWGADFTEQAERYKQDLMEQDERHKQEKLELLDEKRYWKALCERFLGLAETQGQLLKVRGASDITRIDEANRRLLDSGGQR